MQLISCCINYTFSELQSPVIYPVCTPWNSIFNSVTVPPPTQDHFAICCLLLSCLDKQDRSKQQIAKRSCVGGGTVTLHIQVHRLCTNNKHNTCSLPIWRRSPLEKEPLIDLFLANCSALDPSLGGVCRKAYTQVRDYEYFISIKFHKHP